MLYQLFEGVSSAMSIHTARCLRNFLFWLLLPVVNNAFAQQAADTVKLGLDAEFSLENSTSAQAIELGMRIAIKEINDAGGVLGGRPLELLTKDHGSIPARGIRNIKQFAETPGLVAVFGGRFSPVLLEEMPVILETKTLLLAPWSSADSIIDNGSSPNYAFRLSLRDSLAMPRMLQECEQRGLKKIGLLLVNTGWGRSNKAAADAYLAKRSNLKVVQTSWYNFKDDAFLDRYETLLKAGAQAIVLVANDDDAAKLVKEVAALPAERRVPILSHWGVTGGQFVRQTGSALQNVDFTIIQTFSFFNARPAALSKFMKVAKPFGISRPEDIQSPVGVAHAYDLTHILAKAINLAGTTERAKVRDALERVKNYDGLIRFYAQPFTKERHEALTSKELLMARYNADGVLVPIKARSNKPSN